MDADGDGEGNSHGRVVECSHERRKAFGEVVKANGESGHQPHVVKLSSGAGERVSVSVVSVDTLYA